MIDTNHDSFFDADNRILREGDRVRLVSAPATLLKGLPESDQAAINERVGKSVIVEGLNNEYHEVELTFTDQNGHIHYIWVTPENVEKINE